MILFPVLRKVHKENITVNSFLCLFSIKIATQTPHPMLHEIALTMIPSIGAALAKNLIAYCGSAEAVFKAPKAKLIKIPLIGNERAQSIIDSKDLLKKAEVELKFMGDYKIQPLFFTDALFPKRLKDCNDAPILLYYKGNTDLNAPRIIAVVGTRNITEYGKELTKHMVEDLRMANVMVLSGLAYGVDYHAHQTAIDVGLPTVGVLGHGLNRIYPDRHRSLAKRMVEQGGLLTEYNSQDDFTPHNFPQRNRIVAGMCDAVVVVESAIKGGAVITANIANSYNKDVFAVPGRVHDKYSTGCNFLVKTYKAQMVETGKDIMDAMLWESETNQGVTKKPEKLQLALSLSKDEQKIYAILAECKEIEIDRLVAFSGMPSGKIAEILLEMEMNDIIHSLPGKRYKLV